MASAGGRGEEIDWPNWSPPVNSWAKVTAVCRAFGRFHQRNMARIGPQAHSYPPKRTHAHSYRRKMSLNPSDPVAERGENAILGRLR